MSFIQKSNVKHLLSPSDRTRIHLRRPDATGYSVAEADASQARQENFAADFFAEHSSPCAAFVLTEHAPDPSSQQLPLARKSA
jgi:hypothetical protein